MRTYIEYITAALTTLDGPKRPAGYITAGGVKIKSFIKNEVRKIHRD